MSPDETSSSWTLTNVQAKKTHSNLRDVQRNLQIIQIFSSDFLLDGCLICLYGFIFVFIQSAGCL